MSITFEVTMPVETVESLQNNAMYLISLESTKDKVNVIKNLMEVGRCVAIAAKKLSYKDETFTAAQLKVLGQENKKRMEMARKDENRDEVGRGYFHHYHLQDLQSLQELFEQQHKERLLQARQEQELKEANQVSISCMMFTDHMAGRSCPSPISSLVLCSGVGCDSSRNISSCYEIGAVFPAQWSDMYNIHGRALGRA